MKNDIPLDDVAVSNCHCEVMYEEIYNSHYFFIKGKWIVLRICLYLYESRLGLNKRNILE